MPQVHYVKKARKAIPSAGVKVGDSYYWWKNRPKGSRSGIRRVSKTRPRPSQLTMSAYYGTVYAIQEQAEDAADAVKSREDLEDLASTLESLAEEAQAAGEECQEKFDNMPEGLQQGDTGQMLEARVNACSEVSEALTNAAETAREKADPDNDEEGSEFDLSDAVDEVMGDLSFDWDG